LSGAMAAGHAGAADTTTETVAPMPADNGNCCDDGTERSPSCHAIPAILPAGTMSRGIPAFAQAVLSVSSVLPVGIEPAGALGPPRTA
jgi:hypothetical protein